nr:hypothetical protein [Rathayibacter rathayi]
MRGLGEHRVGEDEGDVRASLDDDHVVALLVQPKRRGESGGAGADHDDVVLAGGHDFSFHR